MEELMTGLKRTCYCTEVDDAKVGQEVTVTGWTDNRRDFGGLIFVDLRDRSGILQIVFDASKTSDFSKAEAVRNEYVLVVKGTVRLRSDETVNPKLLTGRFEVVASEMRILSEAETTPFQLENVEKVNETLRLQYRYLELRTEQLQNRLMTRSKITHEVRAYMDELGFLDIETPFLGKSTPEGAREYLVPSRVHPGCFYSLPQSPQIFKQLLMISGFDRYYQIARCFRDEDLRANRQPEFTQIDMEMSFVEDQEDVMGIAEGMIRHVFRTVKGIELDKNIRRMPWQEAMDRFGSDKPDTRFGLEITDLSDLAATCGFQVFEGAVKKGGSVRMINAKGFVKSEQPILSRRDIDALTDFVKGYKAKGLAWIAMREDGIQSVITKFMTPEAVDGILQRAEAETGDLLLFVADTNDIVYSALGALRLRLGETAGLIDHSRYDVLWVTDFPMLEWSQEEKRLVAMHHPFTMPKVEDLPLLDTDPAKVRAQAYDLVINGQEAGGGSIRIHSQDIQKKMFRILGFTDQQIADRFGFFVEAFKYGAPPHGGLAFGLDRLAMLLTGTDNIKDVIAFPKVQNASDMMTQAPYPVDEKQLRDLSIKVTETE